MADRYVYVSSVGFFILVGTALNDLLAGSNTD
jgi:hypothetical protein